MLIPAHQIQFRALMWVAAGLLGTAVLSIGLTNWWLRVDAIREGMRNADNLAIVLAEQTNRSVQAIDLMLGDVQERVKRVGANTPETFRRLLQGEDTHNLLTDRLSHLSQATFIGLVDNDGQIISSTSQW